jgi:hypothetical protein
VNHDVFFRDKCLPSSSPSASLRERCSTKVGRCCFLFAPYALSQHITVLKHIDDSFLNASNKKPLDKRDIKLVAGKVLKALKPLHKAGYVHTGKIADLEVA